MLYIRGQFELIVPRILGGHDSQRASAGVVDESAPGGTCIVSQFDHVKFL